MWYKVAEFRIFIMIFTVQLNNLTWFAVSDINYMKHEKQNILGVVCILIVPNESIVL